MQIHLQYHHQHTDFSCGPACLRMMFDHLGVHYSEEKLIALCHAMPKTGTSHAHLLAEVEKEKLHHIEKTLAEIADLLGFLDQGHPVIVNYLNPTTNNGHYAIVCGYEGETLLLSDPTNGKDYHISFDEFRSHWHNKNHTSKGWLLVIK